LPEAVSAAVFSRDYTMIAAAFGKQVRFWTVADGKEGTTLTLPTAAASLSFSTDKTKLATTGADGWARVWDVATGRELESYPQGAPQRSVVYLPNNSGIITGGNDKTATFHPIRLQRVIEVAKVPVRGIAL